MYPSFLYAYTCYLHLFQVQECCMMSAKSVFHYLKLIRQPFEVEEFCCSEIILVVLFIFL